MTDKKKRSNKSHCKNAVKSISENYWRTASVILGLVLIASIIFGGVSSSAIGETEAGEKILEFAKSQGVEATLVGVTLQGSVYEVVLSMEGQEVPIYITADGDNLVQGLYPLDTEPVQNTPSQNPTPTEVPKSDKPKVELYVMSICPYGTQAEKGILPVVNLLGDKIDFDLKFVSYAMHDKPEMDENTVQYCIQKNEPEKLTDYLSCYLNEYDVDSWDACIDSVGINRANLETCKTSTDNEFKITELYNDKSTWSGGRYPQYNVDKEDNTKYEVQGSPTLIVNGVKSNAGRSASSYLTGICSAFTEGNIPEECNEDLSSLGNPAPGFGFDTQGGATTAGCGA